jgi:hypothetical protein
MSMVIMQLNRKAVKKNLEFSVIFLLLGVCHCVACQPGPGWEAGPAVACWAVTSPYSCDQCCWIWLLAGNLATFNTEF